MNDAQNIVSQQLAILKGIPGDLWSAWPAFFTFTAVQYASAVIINAIPDIGGPVGLVVGAGVNGARTVVNLVTWDRYKMAGIVSK